MKTITLSDFYVIFVSITILQVIFLVNSPKMQSKKHPGIITAKAPDTWDKSKNQPILLFGS